MTIVKGLIVGALIGLGLLAAHADADSTGAAGFVPNTGLPTLFQPMTH
jgi:hypothetical protein